MEATKPKCISEISNSVLAARRAALTPVHRREHCGLVENHISRRYNSGCGELVKGGREDVVGLLKGAPGNGSGFEYKKKKLKAEAAKPRYRASPLATYM